MPRDPKFPIQPIGRTIAVNARSLECAPGATDPPVLRLGRTDALHSLSVAIIATARDGASFKATNFACVSRTAGRGRCDRAHHNARTMKSVYLYELAPPVSSPCDCQSGARMPRSCSAVLSRDSKSLKDADCLNSAID